MKTDYRAKRLTTNLGPKTTECKSAPEMVANLLQAIDPEIFKGESRVKIGTETTYLGYPAKVIGVHTNGTYSLRYTRRIANTTYTNTVHFVKPNDLNS